MKMGPSLKMSQLTYDAAILMVNLRREIGFSKFGLVVQALFAHVILRLGGKVLDIKNPGHPDIYAVMNGQLYYIEVETAMRKTIPRRLEQGDLDVLLVTREGERGYYCVLDTGPPLAWLCVDVKSLGQRVTGLLRMAILRSYVDRDLSADCTAEFSRLVASQARVLDRLSYEQLRTEALNANPI